MKTKSILLALALLAPSQMFGEVKHNADACIFKYQEEIGYFQKANRDLGDPRFMFYDSDSKMSFGIGGTVKASALYGFRGGTNQATFHPSDIYIPTDPSHIFLSDASASEIHAKMRSEWRGHKIVAYLKLGANTDNTIKLDQAYISVGGFSLGLIPSFFMDLESGVMTAGYCPGSAVDKSHTLFGYTTRLGKSWILAAAAEKAELNLDDFGKAKGVRTESQPMPDLTGRVKYRWKNGHVQLAGVARNLTYWAVDEAEIYTAGGTDRHCFGYGIAFSGNWKPGEKLKFSWNLIHGRGIASYLPDYSSHNMDLALKNETLDDLALMSTVPIYSGMIAAQYDWSKHFGSSVQLSASTCRNENGANHLDPTSKIFSGLVNLFWYPNDLSYIGIEYQGGIKNISPTPGIDATKGDAHRFVATLAVFF